MNTNDLANFLANFNSSRSNVLDNIFSLNPGKRDDIISNLDLSNLNDVDKALLQQLYFADGDRDANMQVFQNKLEIALGERNYVRSLPINQLAQLQAAGMSRSAALQLLQGGGDSATQVSPISTDIEGHDMQRNNLIANTGFQSIDALQRIATLPFDIRAKAATADLLRSQDTMLNEQKQGLALSAAAVQAAANNGFSFEGANANDLMQFLATNQNTQSLLNSINSNPYAFSSLTHLMSQDFQTRAASYEPQFASSRLIQQQALTSLTENDVKNLDMMNELLGNQVYRDSITSALYGAVEYAKANATINAADFDAARFKSMIDDIQNYTLLDHKQLMFQLHQIKMLDDPKLRSAQLEELVKSSKFQAAQAYLGLCTTNLVQGQFNVDNITDFQKLSDAANDFLYGVTLGGYQDQANSRAWINSGTGAAATVLAYLFAARGAIKGANPSMWRGYTTTSTYDYTPSGIPIYR